MEPAQLTGVTLDRLVAALEAAHTDVRERIPDAMLVAEHLGHVGEDLIEHVVSTARAHGISWSEIGSQMGVSKQAAQQRLAKASKAELEPLDPKQGFTRFSIDGRNLLIAAHEAARTQREPFVTPARLALTAGIASAEAHLPKPSKKQQPLVPYDDAAQNVLARAFEVAVAHDADMVEVSHLVAALRGDFPEA